jgi:hypothetical protein
MVGAVAIGQLLRQPALAVRPLAGGFFDDDRGASVLGISHSASFLNDKMIRG